MAVEAPLRNLERIWSDKKYADSQVDDWLAGKKEEKEVEDYENPNEELDRNRTRNN